MGVALTTAGTTVQGVHVCAGLVCTGVLCVHKSTMLCVLVCMAMWYTCTCGGVYVSACVYICVQTAVRVVCVHVGFGVCVRCTRVVCVNARVCERDRVQMCQLMGPQAPGILGLP